MGATTRPARFPPSTAAIAAGVATAVALVSAWQSAGRVWRHLNEGHATFAAYSEAQRVEAPVNEAGFTFLASLLDQVAAEARRDDRVFFQVPHRAFGTLDLHDSVAALGRFTVLPAVETTSLDDATLVVSYEANPADLHRRFVTQRQYGSAFISRLAGR